MEHEKELSIRFCHFWTGNFIINSILHRENLEKSTLNIIIFLIKNDLHFESSFFLLTNINDQKSPQIEYDKCSINGFNALKNCSPMLVAFWQISCEYKEMEPAKFEQFSTFSNCLASK